MRSVPSMECLGSNFILKELFCAKNVFLLFFKLWKVNITLNALRKNATFYYPSEWYSNVTHEKCTHLHPLHLFQFAKCGDLKIRCRFPFIENDLKCWLDLLPFHQFKAIFDVVAASKWQMQPKIFVSIYGNKPIMLI